MVCTYFSSQYLHVYCFLCMCTFICWSSFHSVFVCTDIPCMSMLYCCVLVSVRLVHPYIELFIAVYNWTLLHGPVTMFYQMHFQVTFKSKGFLTIFTLIFFTLCMTVGKLPQCGWCFTYFTTFVTSYFLVVHSKMII